MATFLGDESALARSHLSSAVHDVLAPLFAAADIATCSMVDLEMLYSATSPGVYVGLRRGLTAMPRVAMSEEIFQRAIEVQGLLADRSRHRGVSLPDLLVAAAAETAGLTVLHYDAGYDRISAVTGQRTRWVVPRGSID